MSLFIVDVWDDIRYTLVETHRKHSNTLTVCRLKPRFHCADFRVSAISPFHGDVRDANGLVANLSLEFVKPSRHVAMVWNPETSPWRVSRESFRKVGVMEFGLNQPIKKSVSQQVGPTTAMFVIAVVDPGTRISFLFATCRYLSISVTSLRKN